MSASVYRILSAHAAADGVPGVWFSFAGTLTSPARAIFVATTAADDDNLLGVRQRAEAEYKKWCVADRVANAFNRALEIDRAES